MYTMHINTKRICDRVPPPVNIPVIKVNKPHVHV